MSEIDYKARSEHLLRKLSLWLAQMEWEKRHGSLVAWDKAIAYTLAHPDGDKGVPTANELLLAQAIELLSESERLLGKVARVEERFALRARIQTFGRCLTKEEAA